MFINVVGRGRAAGVCLVRLVIYVWEDESHWLEDFGGSMASRLYEWLGNSIHYRGDL